MATDLFGYDGKRVLVVGGATGMGAATATMARDLGAAIVVMDVAEVDYECAQSISVDLRDRAAVDAAIDEIDGPVDTIFACAGVADGTPGLMLINFTAQRHLIERLIREDLLNPSGSVAFISSTAGLGWRTHAETVGEFLDCDNWADAAGWVESHEGTDNYSFSKEAINLFVTRECFRFLKGGHRLNAIMPGPTVTPLAEANADLWLTYAAGYREAAGVDTLTPEQMASTLIFLGSAMASGVNGELLDQGHTNAALTDGYEEPLVKMLAGEMEFDISALG